MASAGPIPSSRSQAPDEGASAPSAPASWVEHAPPGGDSPAPPGSPADPTPVSSPIPVACVRLRPEVQLPAYQTKGAAGLDLQAFPEDNKPLVIAPRQRLLVPTGLQLAIPPGYEGQVRPRSGWALKYGVTVLNSPGTIDSDYRGEVRVLLINLGEAWVTIQPGDRIAQIVFCPVTRAQLVEVDSLDETLRGAGGFGHSGLRSGGEG